MCEIYGRRKNLMKLTKISAILLLGAVILSTVSPLIAPREPQGLQTKTITLDKAAFN